MKNGILVLLFITCLMPAKGQKDPYLAGRARMIKGEYVEATRLLQEALKQEPGNTEIIYQLGICFFRQNRYPEARDAFYGVEKRRKGMGSMYLAKTESRLNHPEQALKYLKENLQSKYKVAEKQIRLDPDLSLLEGTAAWQQLWNEREWYDQGDRDFQEAQFMKENGRELEAINLLNQLEKQGYEKSMVLAEKAEVYTKLGNPKAALSAYQSAVKADVRNLNALYELSVLQLESGNPKDAMSGFDRLIRQEPDRFEAYLMRARAASELDGFQAAMDDLETYLSYFPEDPDAYYLKGRIQHQNGRYLDAIKSFNTALGIDQGKAEYFYARGLTYASTGTLRSAEKDFSMALDLDPLNGQIWFEKARISQELGHVDDACFSYRKAYQYGIFKAGEMAEKLCN